MGDLLVSWRDYNTNVHSLNAAPVQALHDTSGLFAPDYLPIEQLAPGVAGGFLRAINVPTREVLLPLLITGTSYTDLWNNIRTVENWFDPTAKRGSSPAANVLGNSRLIVTAPDGAVRFLACYCVDGLQLVQDAQTSGQLWQLAVAALRAPQPFWQANTQTTVANVVCTLNTLKSTTITTLGDVEAWPIWTIFWTRHTAGAPVPVTILITSATTGASFTATVTDDGTGGALHAVGVATGVFPTCTYDGAPAYSALAPLSNFFPLVAGANAMQYTISCAATLDAITVGVTYTDQFSTP